MNPIIKNLIHKIEVKKTQAHLTNLKTNTTNKIMKIPFMKNSDAQAKIASLEAENARLKASAGGIITVQNKAGENLVPVTTRSATGKITTVNMSLDDAALHSKRMVAGFTSKPSKAPTATATAPAPDPAPAPKRVAFEPTPELAPLTRSEFNSLSPHDRTRFATQGGRLK